MPKSRVQEEAIVVNNRAYASVMLGLALLWSGGLRAADLGTAEQAHAMLERAAGALKADQDAALKAFNDENNKEFRDRDLFVYCFNLADGKFTAYQSPFLLNNDIREMKLYDEPMGQRAYDAAHDAADGAVVTIEYKFPKPGTKNPVPKEAFEERVGDQACGVSYFK
jgi:cytochrome c